MLSLKYNGSLVELHLNGEKIMVGTNLNKPEDIELLSLVMELSVYIDMRLDAIKKEMVQLEKLDNLDDSLYKIKELEQDTLKLIVWMDEVNLYLEDLDKR